MKSIHFSHAAFILLLLLSASISRAQTISSQKGLTTIEFVLKEGSLKVRLPDNIRPGDLISGTVLLEPAGKSVKERTKSLNHLLERNIRIGQTTGPAQKMHSFPLQTQGKQELLRFQTTVAFPFAVSLFSPDGKELQQPVTIRVDDVFPTQTACANPTHVLSNSPCMITGPFDGDAANTKCSINNIPVEVIAESPRQTVIQVPDLPAGEKQVSISENGKQICVSAVKTVELIVTAGKMNLSRAETSFIETTVNGLDRLKDTAVLTITNQSTDVIVMSPMNTQTIYLLPDSFHAQTSFSKRNIITGVRPGVFNVNVNLDLPGVMYDVKAMENKFEQHPGSYGWRGDDPCETKGPITWRWHRTLPCAIELKVEEYGVTPEDKEVIDFIIDKFKKLSKKGGNIGEKMAKCLSFKGKAFWIFARCYRDWDDWDVTYECINGVWVQTSMVYVTSGRDNLSGWIKLMAAGGNYEWLPADSFNWVTEGIAKSVFCCD